MKNYKIYLIRNGLTQGTLEGRYIGHTDESLCEQGIAQIKELALTGYFPEAEAVFSSPLKRCTETAELIYPNKKPILFNELMECNFGEFEGLTAEELNDNEDFRSWLKGENDSRAPFGESNGEFSTRICNGFIRIIEGILKTGIRETAIITHGGIIMSLLSAFGLPEAPLTDWRCPSGCGYMLSLNASIWSRLRKIEVIDEIPFTVRDEADSDWVNDGSEYFFYDYDSEAD